MSLEKVMSIASSAMSAQTIRLSVTASNMANAQTVGSSVDTTYHARSPVFSTILDGEEKGGVRVSEVLSNGKNIQSQYQPNNPMADENGYIYLSNVSSIDEKANMISASNDYLVNANLLNSAKNMLSKTLRLIE
jgi:flagellar basal-body rod protein FlgC